MRRAVAGRCGLKHLAPAERLRLVHVDDATGRLAFRHSLMRSAVVDLSTSDQRRSAHRALAEAWTGVPEQRAWHLAQAAVDPDEQIAALLEEGAGISARRGDGPNAVAALVRAAALSPAAAEQARRLAKAAYLGTILTGGVRDVPRLLDDARQAAPDGASLADAVATALYLLNSYGDVDTAHRLLSGAIALQPEPYDPTDGTVLEALSTLLMVCVYGARSDLWADYDAAAAKCTAVPDTLRLLRTTFADPARALPSDWTRLDAAVEALSGTSDPVRIVRIGTAGAYADRLGAMDEPLRRTAWGGRTGEKHLPRHPGLVPVGQPRLVHRPVGGTAPGGRRRAGTVRGVPVSAALLDRAVRTGLRVRGLRGLHHRPRLGRPDGPVGRIPPRPRHHLLRRARQDARRPVPGGFRRGVPPGVPDHPGR
ncbi:hypothetical protein [Streptomyces sp. NPDC056192]|uniref:hypothetical protein n=1 Tax=Streptomyces sp. NPDC056192 TaxID=3345743 RepID=UPI0035D9AD19